MPDHLTGFTRNPRQARTLQPNLLKAFDPVIVRSFIAQPTGAYRVTREPCTVRELAGGNECVDGRLQSVARTYIKDDLPIGLRGYGNVTQ